MYVICEMDSLQKEDSRFQTALRSLESKVMDYVTTKWFPKFSVEQSFGGLTPKAGSQFGRTTILPALFNDNAGAQMATWRQAFSTAGHQTLITGTRTGNVIPEDFIVGWAGLAFPNKEQHITELRWQIGDRKYGRINIEELKGYNKPAIIFEEGSQIDEEESFELYGYVKGPIPAFHDGYGYIHQRIVMLGAAYYKVVSKVLGNAGAAI